MAPHIRKLAFVVAVEREESVGDYVGGLRPGLEMAHIMFAHTPLARSQSHDLSLTTKGKKVVFLCVQEEEMRLVSTRPVSATSWLKPTHL